MNTESTKSELKESTELPPLSWELIGEGLTLDGDNGCPPGELPPWLDREKFYDGQRACRDNLAMLLLGSIMGLIASLPDDYVFTVFTSLESQKSSRGIGRRFCGTLSHLMKWYETDVLDKRSEGYRSILAVRCYHKLYMKKLPETLGKHPQGHLWLSQNHMARVQMTLIDPTIFKVYGTALASEEDLEGMTYFWRVIGYLLGISDRYNPCRDGFKALYRLRIQTWENILLPAAVRMTPDKALFVERTCDAVFGSFVLPIQAYDLCLQGTADLVNGLGLSTPELSVTRTIDWKHRVAVNIMTTFVRTGIFSWSPVRALIGALARIFIKKASAEKLPPERFPEESDSLGTFVCPYAFKLKTKI